MATEIIWSKRARESLLDIYVAIGVHNPAAAERFYLRVETLAGRLARHPRMGRRRPDLRPAARMLVERPYLVLYEVIPDLDDGPVEAVEIMNVIDGRRNLFDLI